LHLILGAGTAGPVERKVKAVGAGGSGGSAGIVGGSINVPRVSGATPRSGSGAVGRTRYRGTGIGAGVVRVAGVCGAVGSGRARAIGRTACRSGDRVDDHISGITLTARAGAGNGVGGRFGACGGVGQRAGGDRAGRGRDSGRSGAGPAAVLRAGDRGGGGIADSVVERYGTRAGDRGRAGCDAARGRGCRGGGGLGRYTTAAALHLATRAGTAGVTGSIKAVGAGSRCRGIATAAALYLTGGTAAAKGVRSGRTPSSRANPVHPSAVSAGVEYGDGLLASVYVVFHIVGRRHTPHVVVAPGNTATGRDGIIHTERVRGGVVRGSPIKTHGSPDDTRTTKEILRRSGGRAYTSIAAPRLARRAGNAHRYSADESILLIARAGKVAYVQRVTGNIGGRRCLVSPLQPWIAARNARIPGSCVAAAIFYIYG